ncbi:MAG: DUF4908 domain-containing protein [Rhizomicrobium sp.]
MVRVSIGLVVGALLFGALDVQGAQAEASLQSRISSDRPGRIESGTYLAGDHIGFALAAAGADYLLSFDGSPEIFVLHANNASLGGRVLKYDSGETALLVSGWGGITLYTDADPAGLPAVRTGECAIPAPVAAVSVADVENAALDDAEHLAWGRRLDLAFSADWNALADSAPARAMALDAMENVTRGIERFGKSAPGHAALARNVKTVVLATAGQPTVTLKGSTLLVTFDPDRGLEGRASSRTISRALRALLRATHGPG